jgi:hypothetical protein
MGAVEVCAPVFGDLDSASLYDPFAAELYCRSVTVGCGAQPPRFCPTQNVTRAQMAVLLVVAVGEPPSGALHDAYFDDLYDGTPEGDFRAYSPYVNRLKELGVTAGCGTRAYCPNDAVNRAQAAVLLVTALGERPSSAAYDAYFDDLYDGTPQNDYRPYAPFINRMKELGVTSGCGARAYCPADPVSRQAAAVFLATAFFR